jgi:glycosyltransferase involved in cell wall biosynthesis
LILFDKDIEFMTILIFGDHFTFPEGDASANRVYYYAKGFSEEGFKVHVICFDNSYNSSGDGKIEDIHYYHPFKRKTRSNYFIIRRWHKFRKYIDTLVLLTKISRGDKATTMIVYAMNLMTHLFAWYFSRISGAKLIRECSEHPLRHYHGNFLIRNYGLLKMKTESYLCDGIFCISRFLVNYFKTNGISEAKLFLIPSTVDPFLFTESVEENPVPFSYIGYFGGLTFERDNIDILIEAFAIVTSTHPDIHLVLGGFCSEDERKQLENFIREFNISSKVVLLEYLTRKEILKYIKHSDILIMVRSNDENTKASFPSKLTEYLAASKPVITVNVGEIADYLTDGLNCFIVEPGDINGLADKISYVLGNYNTAMEIAQQGYKLTSGIFSYRYQADRCIKFIATL